MVRHGGAESQVTAPERVARASRIALSGSERLFLLTGPFHAFRPECGREFSEIGECGESKWTLQKRSVLALNAKEEAN